MIKSPTSIDTSTTETLGISVVLTNFYVSQIFIEMPRLKSVSPWQEHNTAIGRNTTKSVWHLIIMITTQRRRKGECEQYHRKYI